MIDMTIEDLAKLTSEGFSHTQKQFDELARFTHDGFQGTQKQLAAIYRWQERADEKFEQILRRLDNVAYKVELRALERRVEKLENKV